MKKDIRNLCCKCANDMKRAGYKLKRTRNEYTTECDKCDWQGYEYEVKGNKNELRI